MQGSEQYNGAKRKPETEKARMSEPIRARKTISSFWPSWPSSPSLPSLPS
jgi:hypothetical protein